MRFPTMIVAALCATPALADVTASFIEGAPKDRFVITNSSTCAIGMAQVQIDFANSAGALVFDTEPTGAGVEVFQPLEIVEGEDRFARPPVVRDGDSQVTLDLVGLNAGQSVAFTIDVDDTVGARQITVNGSEIAGAEMRLNAQAAVFDDNATAVLALSDCET